MTTDTIAAGKHFSIDKWPRIKHAALLLALMENQTRPEHRDVARITRICTRFKVGREYSFYTQNPELLPH